MNEYQRATLVGDIGEKIVDDYLYSKGYSVYRPQRIDVSHPFDRVAFRKQGNRFSRYIVETKTKPHRSAYPDTGFNLRCYNVYLTTLQDMPVWVFWVDESTRSIYGNDLAVLSQKRTIQHKGRSLGYPLIQGDIIYFPLEAMHVITALTENQCRQLREHARTNFTK